jgi:hypothetical protein
MIAGTESPTAGFRRRTVVVVFFVGCFLGFAIGMLTGVLSVKAARELFANAMHGERSADVDHTVSVTRSAFAFQYPGNWKIDTTDADYDADHMFSVDSPGQSMVQVTIMDGSPDPKTHVDTTVTTMTSKLIPDGTRTPFTHWGAYEGEGALLKGKLLGLTSGTIRIFAWRSGKRTFAVMEQTFDEDRARVTPGFELIERTFRVTPAP